MIPTLQSLLKIDRDELKASLKLWCHESGANWSYKRGDMSDGVVIVGHIDTAHDKQSWGGKWNSETQTWESKKGKRFVSLYYDKKRETFWSPNGLGADDRAGVFLMFQAYNSMNPKPSLLFTDLEESGGKGAEEAARDLKGELSRALMFVEWDRKNGNDAVFYQNEPEEFRKYVESFGYTDAHGSFSDVSVLSLELEICGVNLSCGYYDQHTNAERLDVRDMWSSYGKGKKLIADAMKSGRKWGNPRPPKKEPTRYSHYGYGRPLYDGEEDYYWCNYGMPSPRVAWRRDVDTPSQVGGERYYDDRPKQPSVIVPIGTAAQSPLFGSIGQRGDCLNPTERQLLAQFKRANKKRRQWEKKWARYTAEDFERNPYLAAQKDYEETLLLRIGL